LKVKKYHEEFFLRGISIYSTNYLIKLANLTYLPLSVALYKSQTATVYSVE